MFLVFYQVFSPEYLDLKLDRPKIPKLTGEHADKSLDLGCQASGNTDLREKDYNYVNEATSHLFDRKQLKLVVSRNQDGQI